MIPYFVVPVMPFMLQLRIISLQSSSEPGESLVCLVLEYHTLHRLKMYMLMSFCR